MTFATLKATIAGETGLDVTTDATVLNTWLNGTYKKVLGAMRWPWLLKNSTIQTVADITTGTVAINAGSTSGTFSSAPTVSVANQYLIQFTSVSDDWYMISAHTASQTSFTLANAFNGAANISGASYICRKVYYSFPSDCDGIISLRQARTDTDLIAADIRTLDRYLPDPIAVAEPQLFCVAGYDSSKNWQFVLYPTPNTVMNLQLRYYQMPADMSGDSDTPLLPEKFHDILIFGALYMYGHPYIDDSRVATAKVRYDSAMAEMKLNFNPLPAQLNVIQTWDSRPRNPNGMLRWPANFPQYRGY
jgi:hypothetical protein